MPDIRSMTISELNNFCVKISKKTFNPSVDVKEKDEFFNSVIDFDYYSINKFNKLKSDKTSSFGVAHVNIASLDAHIDGLGTTLSKLKSSFDVIGISEHKIRKGSDSSNNIDLRFDQKLVFEPTELTVTQVFN